MIKQALAFTAIALASSMVSAGPTIDRLKATDNINIGMRQNVVPYNILDPKFNRFSGYSNDICLNIVKKLESKIGKSLTISKREVSAQARFNYLLNGNTDLNCAADSLTPERLKMGIGFAIMDADPVVPAGLKSGTQLTSLEDLKGKRIALTAGTTAEKAIRQLNSQKGFGAVIVPDKDYSEGFALIEQGRADYIATNSVLLAGNIATLSNGSSFKLFNNVIIDPPELIGIAYHSKDKEGKSIDPEFEETVQGALSDMKKDGTLEVLYKKWFSSTLPNGKNLNLTWTAEQKKAVWGN